MHRVFRGTAQAARDRVRANTVPSLPLSLLLALTTRPPRIETPPMTTTAMSTPDAGWSPSHPLLGGHDLDDPDQFLTVRRVPILDSHSDDPERGPVDEPMLRRIAANSNNRAARGDFPALILGHTRPKKEKEEIDQPPVVGYASSFHIDDYRGTPCLYCDFHVYTRDSSYAKSFPFRSVERLESPDDYVDRIALLRTPPQRDLGALHYARADDGAPIRRIIYGRAFPHQGDDDPTSGRVNDPESSPSTETQSSEETAMAEPTAPAAPAADQAAAPQMTIGQMAPEQFVALIVEGFRQALHEEAGAPNDTDGDGVPDEADADADGDGVPDTQQYEDETAMGDEPDPGKDDDRAAYEASEAGSCNTYTPGGEDPEKRRMYEESDRIKRHRYERDLSEQREINELLIQTVSELKHENRRVLYERKLIQLESEGYEIDRADEMDSLRIESPDDYEAAQESRIRKCYRRSPVGTRSAVPVANFVPPDPAGTARPMDRSQVYSVVDYATRNGCSIPEAKKALNIG